MSTPPDAALRDTLLLGAAAGLRTFAPGGVIALRGDLGAGRPSRLLPLAAAGELVGDKLPFVPARTTPVPLAGRALSGGLLGLRRGGAQAAVAGAAVAVVAAYGGQHTRQWLGRRTGRPDVQLALLEDAVAVGLALAGSRRA